MTQVFISYSRKDLEFVDRLANDLKATGFEVWYDLSGLEPGTRWRQEIQKAIQESQYFLVVLSPNSIVSDWVEREFLFASDQDKKIIPLLYQACTLPMWSLNLHFIDMQGKNYAVHYQELLRVMGIKTGSEENPIAIRYIEIGDEYRKRGQTSQAIESYLQAIKVDPVSLRAHTNIGAIHLMEQAYTEAAAAYEMALQISSENLVARAGWCEANMALGNQARAEGRIEDAIRYYTEILGIAPEESNARQSLVNIYTSQAKIFLTAGKEDEALQVLYEAIKYSPRDLDLTSLIEKLRTEKKNRVMNALAAKSDAEVSAGNWDAAFAVLNEALEFEPKDESILKKIGEIKKQQLQQQLETILFKVDIAEKEQRWDTALAGLKDYLTLKPDDEILQRHMADLMQSKHSAWLAAVNLMVDQSLVKNDWEAALSALNEALQLEPDNMELSARIERVGRDQRSAKVNAMILRADQAASAGRWDDAIELLNSGLIHDPENATLKNKLTETLQNKRKLRLRSVLDKADAAMHAGKWESALAALNQVLAEEPDNREFLEKYNQILALERRNKLDNLRLRARNLVKQQKYEEALSAWNEILLLTPEGRQAVLTEIEAVNTARLLEDNYAQGLQAFDAKDYQKAIELLNPVQQEQPGYKDAARLLSKSRKLLSSEQKKRHPENRKVWVLGAALTLLALGIYALVTWLGKDHPSPPVFVATNTATSIATSLPSISPTPQIKILIVTSAEDDGPGTLRQALLDARSGDTITFDPATFPAEDPVPINLYSTLPIIDQGYLTMDGSNAGVVLNGAHVGGEWTAGIDIWSDYNIIKGLGIIGFSGPGIALQSNANFNTIGGDRNIGLSQIGEGNFVGANSDGMAIWGSYNVITGNLVGILGADSKDLEVGNKASGIFIADLASHNTIGPDNIIAYNGKISGGGGCGIDYISLDAKDNNLTANIIFGNEPASPAICYNINPGGRFVYSTPPSILYFELDSGLVAGGTCPSCLVEIFSTETQDGRIYEGSVTADGLGNFIFQKSGPLSGPFLTATTRSPGENTSEFSLATAARSDVQIALDAMQSAAPQYQTSFDSWDIWNPDPNAKLQDGKLIITSLNDEHISTSLTLSSFDKYAVEFDVRILEGSPGGHCVFYSINEAYRSKNVVMFTKDQAVLGYQNQDTEEELAMSNINNTKVNMVKLIFLGEQIAAFFNGQMAFTKLNPDGSTVFTSQSFAATYTIVCEFDNYKLWDLSRINFLP